MRKPRDMNCHDENSLEISRLFFGKLKKKLITYEEQDYKGIQASTIEYTRNHETYGNTSKMLAQGRLLM